jgi:hypothetical protein
MTKLEIGDDLKPATLEPNLRRRSGITVYCIYLNNNTLILPPTTTTVHVSVVYDRRALRRPLSLGDEPDGHHLAANRDSMVMLGISSSPLLRAGAYTDIVTLFAEGRSLLLVIYLDDLSAIRARIKSRVVYSV